MENASKALIMAAEVLVGVIIISIGVALFTIFSNYSKNTAMQIEATQIAEFNNNFLKYEGVEVTAHDIVSIANLARQNNIDYDVADQREYNENTTYIQVQVVGIKVPFEKQTEEEKSKFIQENTFENDTEGNIKRDSDGNPTKKSYICTRVLISEVTHKVMYVEFKEKK